MSTEVVIIPLSSSVIQWGDRQINVQTASSVFLKKLLEVIRSQFNATQKYMGMEHTLRMLRSFETEAMTSEQRENLRGLLLIFVQQWWNMSPAKIPEKLEDVAKLVKEAERVRPTIREKPHSIDDLLVVDTKGSMQIVESLGRIKKALDACKAKNAGDKTVDCVQQTVIALGEEEI